MVESNSKPLRKIYRCVVFNLFIYSHFHIVCIFKSLSPKRLLHWTEWTGSWRTQDSDYVVDGEWLTIPVCRLLDLWPKTCSWSRIVMVILVMSLNRSSKASPKLLCASMYRSLSCYGLVSRRLILWSMVNRTFCKDHWHFSILDWSSFFVS